MDDIYSIFDGRALPQFDLNPAITSYEQAYEKIVAHMGSDFLIIAVRMIAGHGVSCADDFAELRVAL